VRLDVGLPLAMVLLCDVPVAVANANTTDAALNLLNRTVSHLHQLDHEDKQLMTQALLVIAAGLGLAGYFVKAWLDQRAEVRRLKLLWLDRQMGEFWGPLGGLEETTECSYNSALRKYAIFKGYDPESSDLPATFSKELDIAEESNDPTGEAAQLWMDFIRNSCLNFHERIESILDEKRALFDGAYPNVVLRYRCHVAELRLLSRAWDRKDFRHLGCKAHLYPKEFHSWLVDEGTRCLQKRNNLVNELYRERSCWSSKSTRLEADIDDTEDKALLRHTRASEAQVQTCRTSRTRSVGSSVPG